MKNAANNILTWVMFILFLNSCTPNATPFESPTNDAVISVTSAQTPIPAPSATATRKPPPLSTLTFTPVPKGKTIIVLSIGDSGAGSFRQALIDARQGDIIAFDPQIFPPEKPVVIYPQSTGSSALPKIHQGYITIDASNAGVILDGSNAQSDWVNGLEISSDGNIIQGLQIMNFSGQGIVLCGGSNNIIGGDSQIGRGPIGQRNLISRNGVGIGVCGKDTSRNTIRGNLIGADPTGMYELPRDSFLISNEWGNKYDGIWIDDGANSNTIGPDNIISYNHYNGIRIYGKGAIHNIITHNSIHDNAGAGIQLSFGSNDSIEPPKIQEYQTGEGLVKGATCANCLVEIYSDENSEGEIFEGSTFSDNNGHFTFEKGESFILTRLTTIAIDPTGNTSPFSLSVGAVSNLQTGNELPLIPIQPKTSAEMTDTRIGTQWHSLFFVSDFELEEMLTDTLQIGLKRFRLAVNNSDSENVDLFWENQEFFIAPKYDKFITALNKNGIRITYLLSFWDKDYRNGGGVLTLPRFQSDDQVERYHQYVKFIVHHFNNRVQYYEIWNEPSSSYFPMQWIKPEDYLQLVKKTVDIIHQENPQAKIVIGSTHGLTDQESREYLFSILRSDILPLVDVVAWHPMYGSSPEYDLELKNYYYNYPSLVQNIKETAIAHGFKGEFVADELLWRPPETVLSGNGWSGASDEIKAAKYTARGILINLGMDVSVTVQETGNVRRPPLVTFVLQNLSANMAGNQTIDLPVAIQSEADFITHYDFELPNGDLLVALWNDGVTTDYDPGILSRITIPEFEGWTATGIDVLNGYEQELEIESVEESLVIEDFLIKDYPILIRLSE